jgi:hypothetical protein
VSITRSSYNVTASSFTSSFKNNTTTRSLGSKRPKIITSTHLRLGTTALLRSATAAKPPFDKVDTDAERKTLEQQLQAHPSDVTGASSVRAVFEAKPKKVDEDTDMLGGIKTDLVRFALTWGSDLLCWLITHKRYRRRSKKPSN